MTLASPSTVRQVSRPRRQAPLSGSAYLVWLLAPIVAFFIAFRNYQSPVARNLVWLFIAFYGFTFVISSEQLDASRYRNELEAMHKKSVQSLPGFFALLYSDQTNYVDVVQPLITFGLSRFTDDVRILMLTFAVVFGFFYSRNLWFLLDRVNVHMPKMAWGIFFLFALIVAFWQLNGFRFYTGVHVFLYGFFRYASGRRISGLTWAAGAMLVHFSMVMPVALFIGYGLAGNRLVMYYAVFFASFFVAQVSPTLFKAYSDSLPAVFQKRTEKYVSDPYLKARAKLAEKPVNWYVNGRNVALQYGLIAILIWIFFRWRVELYKNRVLLSILCFALVVGAVVNIASSLPSMVRFYSIYYLLVLAALFFLLNQVGARVIPVFILLPFVGIAALYALVEIRIGFDTMGVLTVLGNPIVAVFLESDTALINLIK